MIERDFYWINPQSVVIPKGKLQEKINRLPFKGITDNRLINFSFTIFSFQYWESFEKRKPRKV
jgi:hypothetical protein